MIGSYRISVVEYGSFESIESHAAKANISGSDLAFLLRQTAERIRSTIGISQAIEFDGDRFRFIDVAGVLRLTARIELEIRPKFLGEKTGRWREDFFAIATLVRYGRILPQDTVLSSIVGEQSLADLMGQAFITLYDKNRRRPLRAYRRRTWVDFSADGELDPETVYLPSENGFSQTGIVLDRQNPYNQVFHRAVSKLAQEVREGDVRRRLYQTRADLSPQTESFRNAPLKLPSRQAHWQDLYNLSKNILGGYGLGYEGDEVGALPGYIIRTADAWEALLFAAVRVGMPDRHVSKRAFQLGIQKKSDDSETIVETHPDIVIEKTDGSIFLVDSKYKGRVKNNGKEDISISSTDLYESLAFMESTDSKRLVLIYPRPSFNNENVKLGESSVFERITVGNREIIGVTIDPTGIASNNGFKKFSMALSGFLRTHFDA